MTHVCLAYAIPTTCTHDTDKRTYEGSQRVFHRDIERGSICGVVNRSVVIDDGGGMCPCDLIEIWPLKSHVNIIIIVCQHGQK